VATLTRATSLPFLMNYRRSPKCRLCARRHSAVPTRSLRKLRRAFCGASLLHLLTTVDKFFLGAYSVRSLEFNPVATQRLGKNETTPPR
jgi:hypothetical protein